MTTRAPRRGLRYRYRLVAAMLLVSLPLMVVLAVLLTSSASTSLTASAQDKGESVARALTLRVEEWVSDRQESLAVLADCGERSAGGGPDPVGAGGGGSQLRRVLADRAHRLERQGARLQPWRCQHRCRRGRTGSGPPRLDSRW